jgi:hypothetical protein
VELVRAYGTLLGLVLRRSSVVKSLNVRRSAGLWGGLVHGGRPAARCSGKRLKRPDSPHPRPPLNMDSKPSRGCSGAPRRALPSTARWRRRLPSNTESWRR